MKSTRIKPHKGFALLLALIVSSVVLAIGASILSISISQINLAATARESELAFQSAHAGVDCMWFWKNERTSEYIAENEPIPTINCFNESPISSNKTGLYSVGGSHANLYAYTFDWGDPARCTETEMVVINAAGGAVELTFENEGVGTDGVKECLENNICTIIFSKGYNRSCDELDTSIFSLQREITVEF